NISIARKKELENNFNTIKNKINDLKLLNKNSLFQGGYL
ncbi:site-specific DNA-methyltransferase, partial [Campylobacter coli]|nr:site-specific DNA-methyltransferase [Campylobacter coli]